MLPPPPISSENTVVHNILSYDSNIMLVAIISLLLVILFVLLLHVYAKWFLVQAARRGRTRGAVSAPRVLGVRLHHHFHNFSIDRVLPTSPSKGLDASVISTIPVFVYRSGEPQQGLECVICLSVFEDKEVGRKLSKCEHSFHVECIDMWLHNHTSCPTCRGPAIGNINDEGGEHGRGSFEVEELEIVVVEGPIDENVSTNGTLVVCESPSVSSPRVPNSLGDSLKRMMSRSTSIGKITPEREEPDQ